jgi:hypothetical protein
VAPSRVDPPKPSLSEHDGSTGCGFSNSTTHGDTHACGSSPGCAPRRVHVRPLFESLLRCHIRRNSWIISRVVRVSGWSGPSTLVRSGNSASNNASASRLSMVPRLPESWPEPPPAATASPSEESLPFNPAPLLLRPPISERDLLTRPKPYGAAYWWRVGGDHKSRRWGSDR